MQSDGIVSHVYSWKPRMTQHHMCFSAHKRWCDTTSSALSFACVIAFFIYFFNSSFTSSFSPPLSTSPPFLLLSVFVCACVHMTSIWWIKSNALIPSQTGPPLHVRSEMPLREKLHLSACHSGRRETMATTGFFLLTLVCPQTNKLSSFPSQLGCNSKNSS